MLWDGAITFHQAIGYALSSSKNGDVYATRKNITDSEANQTVHDAISYLQTLSPSEQISETQNGDAALTLAQKIQLNLHLKGELIRLLDVLNGALSPTQKGAFLKKKVEVALSSSASRDNLNIFELCAITICDDKVNGAIAHMAKSATFGTRPDVESEAKSLNGFLGDCYATIQMQSMTITDFAANPNPNHFDRLHDGAIWWAKNIIAHQAAQDMKEQGILAPHDAALFLSGLASQDMDSAIEFFAENREMAKMLLNVKLPKDPAEMNPEGDGDSKINLLLYAALKYGKESKEYSQMKTLHLAIGKRLGIEDYEATANAVDQLKDIGFQLHFSHENAFNLEGKARLKKAVEACSKVSVDAGGVLWLKTDEAFLDPRNGEVPCLSQRQLSQLEKLSEVTFYSLAQLQSPNELRTLLMANPNMEITIGPTTILDANLAADRKLPTGELIDSSGNPIKIRGSDIAKLNREFDGRITWNGFRTPNGSQLDDGYNPQQVHAAEQVESQDDGG
jgi:hypothetical protein